MTNTKGRSPAGIGLTPDDVVRAALDVLDEQGLDAVSTRAIADRLDVRMNTVLWHVKTKSRLLELMAEAILGEVSLTNLDGTGKEQARELMLRLRQTLLSHRDGALVVSGTFSAEPRTLRFANSLVTVLLDESGSRKVAAWSMWALFYFTLGLVQEEQAAPLSIHDRLLDKVSPTEYPALAAVLDDYESAAFDDRFRFGIDGILSSLDHTRRQTQ
ncbi:TetR/AcrR family transcriptional regulator C-terminal domain-containing protein [Nocardia carnea]|uniref:TetR/AcrR family transcriptional regulator C-terminal domain-containing protein n=1 Tax=Nocardia carnea TaxID=37328 RepID=UPI00245876A3|nr:TetR/AcrR family transcriptional regulator C-terminal domain-containing protein [Nocardia carnea]